MFKESRGRTSNLSFIDTYKERLAWDKDTNNELYLIGLREYFKKLYSYLDILVARRWKEKKNEIRIILQEFRRLRFEHLSFYPTINRRRAAKVLDISMFLFYKIYGIFINKNSK